MLFNSSEFILFLALVLGVYWLVGHRAQNLLLLAASYFFYGWWDWRFLSLLAISTIADFFIAQLIRRAQTSGHNRRAGRWLFLSCLVNLGILGVFKYFDFFINSSVDLLETLGLNANIPLLRVVLPVGISFYTFQTMSYTIDVYRKQQQPTRNFLNFGLYVAFFPQLVAGPIERSTHLLPQIEKRRTVTYDDLRTGAALMIMGFFKKVFIADSAAVYVDQIFADPASVGSIRMLLGVYFFAIQIYGDFAGYTDIARGVARLMGINICLNFRQPYFAASITEFWRRWHISLSSWLRDYLYIPLGGSRGGSRRTYRNLIIVMLLGGLWHGASWNFVIWGGLHGLFLMTERLLRGNTIPADRPRGGLAIWGRWVLGALLTFHLVCLAWIFFRASGLVDSIEIIRHIASFTSDQGTPLARDVSLLALSTIFGILFLSLISIDVLCWWNDRELPFSDRWPAPIRGILYGFMIIILSFAGPTDAQPFIYFQF